MNSHFIETMTRRFQSRPCPNGLLEGWHQLEQAVTSAADRHQWQVIQWPTGTGKTEALTVLCATLGLEHNSAALIITKFTDEADEIVRAINEQSGLTLASAAHGKASITEQAMTESRVLVTTHEAYRLALREALDRPASSTRLDLYHRNHHGSRNWIIIDEAFNWIDTYEADLDELSAMCAALSTHVRNAHLDNLQSFLSAIRVDFDASGSDRLLPDEATRLLGSIDLDHLKSIVRDIPVEAIELWRNASLHRRTEETTTSPTEIRSSSFKREYLSLLGRLDAIKRVGRCWLSQRRSRIRLHSSRLLLNTNRPCGVILDATASIDRTYDLLGDRVAILPRPKNMRTYKNVRVHISRPHRVGKEHIARHATTEWPTLVKQIARKVSVNSKILAITHKSTRSLLKHRIPCREQYSAHWHNLDGKNEWREADTVLLYGLPYPDDISPTDTFHACTELWSADWFDGNRTYAGHSNIKAALKHGSIARSAVQAINRARCRIIIDDQGNCEPTDVFILLPRGAVGELIETAIQAEMPDVALLPWSALPVRPTLITPSEKELVDELKSIRQHDVYTKTRVIDRLGITSRTFDRMSATLRKPGSPLAQELAAIGVAFHCTKGRGKVTYFIKQ
ncbi:hypothetical protein AB7M63_007209 [Bradyrhizobium japonicum]